MSGVRMAVDADVDDTWRRYRGAAVEVIRPFVIASGEVWYRVRVVGSDDLIADLAPSELVGLPS